MAHSQFSPSTSFNRSPLVRLLGSLEIAPGAASTQTFAEGLSQWVAWTDAIALSRALGSGASAPDAGAGAAAALPGAMAEFRRVRRELTDAITHDPMFATDTRRKTEAPPMSAADVKAELSIYRRYYIACQRSMEERVGALRAQLRALASAASRELQQLAALDAVMDQALGTHQRRLLGQLPLWLEKRMLALTSASRSAATPPQDLPAAASRDDLALIAQTMQKALLAELELRLQPVDAMVQAIGNEPTRHP